jgi:WD40 repeat protein
VSGPRDQPPTKVDALPPPATDFTLLAQLAFASRGTSLRHTHAARNLVFLSPDALDMDLSDPLQRDFGDYELLEKIGQGGMGVVYRARQRSLNREVAIKLLVAGPWAPTSFIERFQLEAQSAARLEHPNIVTVYESGRQQDLHYFSMRLVRGESLADILWRQTRFPPREAARIVRIVAEAVDYAHRLGVLHLDLKPGNVLIDASGEPLVADFGLARRLDEALAERRTETSGTPSYMAPEQADGRAQLLSRATDIYGLGSVLYELLCGQPPFRGTTAEATLDRVVHEEVQRPRAITPEIPADLEAICLKCLRKDPAERYATAADLAEDLRAFLGDRPVSVRRPPARERVRRWIRREPRLAAAVAGVALVLISGLGATAQQWLRAERNGLASRQLVWENRREAALGLEQDGQGLEALARLLDNVQEEEAAGELSQAAFDRLRIGLLREKGARLIDGTVVGGADPLAVAISDDGTRVAIAFNDVSVRWYNAKTLEQLGQVSLAGRPASGGSEQRAPQLLRFAGDHRLLVTLAWYAPNVAPTYGDTWLVDLDSGLVVEPPASFESFADATFSRNGEWALLRSRSGAVQLWKVAPWAPTSAPLVATSERLVWLLDDHARFAFSLGNRMQGLLFHDLKGHSAPREIPLRGNAGVSAWMLSGDGRTLALGDFEGRVFLLDVESLQWRELAVPRGGREVTWLAFSEDDAWLAVATFDGLAQVVDVASGDPLTGGEMRSEFALQRVGISHQQRLLITTGGSTDITAPTGGETALWRIPARGSRTRTAERLGFAPVRHAQAGRYAVAWSLVSGALVGAGMDGQLRLWRLPRSPTMARRTRQNPDAAHYSPDRIVDVAWNRLRLVQSNHRPSTDWLVFDEPVSYADLVDEGRLLIVVAGTELHGFEAPTLTRRYAPLSLPATPQRLLSNHDGGRVLLSFGQHGGALGHEDRLRVVDARKGKWLPGELTLDGPSRHFSFSPDEQWVVAVGPSDGVTSVIDVDGLESLAEYPHDPFEPVVWAEVHDGRLLLVTDAPDRRYGRDRIVVWNPVTDRIEAEHDAGTAVPESVIVTPSGIVLAGHEFDLQYGGNAAPRRWPRIAVSEPEPFLAVSPDGRVVARAYRYEVQLHEAATGALLGPPLMADREALDSLISVGFTADGKELRAHSIYGYELSWAIDTERGAAGTLRSDLGRLRANVDGPPRVYAFSPAERAALRAGDGGEWFAASAPPLDLAPNAPANKRIPARSPRASDRLVDLAPVYNRGPDDIRSTFWSGMSTLRNYPAGLQRIGGEDFDIRGVVHLRPAIADQAADDDVAERIECLPLPAVRTEALRVLSRNGLLDRVPLGTKLAELTFRYQDGSAARVPLRAGHELRSYDDDSGVPLVFATNYALSLVQGPFDLLANARVPNPSAGRVPRCFDLEVTPPSESLIVLAVTVEPAEAPAAVIGARESGSSTQDGPEL